MLLGVHRDHITNRDTGSYIVGVAGQSPLGRQFASNTGNYYDVNDSSITMVDSRFVPVAYVSVSVNGATRVVELGR